MKKLMMMAIMFVASAAAFAGDSDALKAILKAKTYAEAEQLLKSNLSQLADNAEKAKAYNKLVDLAYETYNDLDNKRMMQQPYDSNVMFENAYNALAAAMECDKYDQLPNAKGKVAPKFHAKNQERLNGARLTVINGGVEFANNQDNKKGYDYFLMYLNSGKSSLFADAESMKNDSNLGLASYYAGRCAILNEDYVAANTALDEALNDTAAEIRDGAFGFKLYAMNRAQKTAADSVKYLNDLKDLMAKYPDNDKVFGTLGDALLQQDKIDELIALCNQHTDNPLSIVYKGMIAMNNKQYEQAIADFANFPEDHPSYLQVVFNRAVCKLNVAGDFQDKNSNRNTGAMTPQNEAKFKELLNAAREDFEIVRGLDPDQQNVHWVVLLRNIYYNLGEDAKYQELENM